MKTVLSTCPYVPAEWIAAHGLRPRRIVPRPATAAPVTGAAAGVCPYASAFVQEAVGAEASGAVVVTTLCDQMRRAAELIARRAGAPVFLLNVPSMIDEQATVLYVSELHRLGRFLAGLGGVTPTPMALAQVMREYDAAREALRGGRTSLRPRDYAQAVARFGETGRLDAVPPAPQERGIPLALVGGPRLQDGFGLFDVIEACGGRVVLDATESGELGLPAPFDFSRIDEDPVAELARAYSGAIPHAARRPNDGLYEWLERMICERQVVGVITLRYLWCDLWHAETRRMKERLPVPVLELDLDGEANAEARLRGRVQAFLEMLT